MLELTQAQLLELYNDFGGTNSIGGTWIVSSMADQGVEATYDELLNAVQEWCTKEGIDEPFECPSCGWVEYPGEGGEDSEGEAVCGDCSVQEES